MTDRLLALARRYGKPVGTLAAGHTAKRIEEMLFDWLLYGTVVALCTTRWGPLVGSLAAFAVMAPLSAAMCLIYLRLYDHLKRDWFGLEAIREFRASHGRQGLVSRLLWHGVRRSNLLAFFVLSIHGDPFLTAVYLRRGTGSSYQGLTGRDWWVFGMSVLIANGYWTLRWTVIVEAIRWVWNNAPS